MPAERPIAAEEAWAGPLYDEVRRMADAMMGGERGGHTLQPTALVHEVWLRLLASRNAASLDRGALLGLAAQAMRWTLTEHARRRAAEKRGGAARRTTLSRLDGSAAPVEPQDLALDLEAALVEMERFDPELVRLVELRFYGGRSTEEIAELLATSARTVKRRWRFARAWLQQRLSEESP